MAKLLSNTRVYGTATVDTQLFVRGSNSAHSTATGSLQVQGGIGVAGGGFFSGVVTATNFSGAFSGSATSANNINGGTAGQLVYQSAPSTTAFTGPGTAGQILISQGTSAPLYVNTTTFAVGLAANLLGGTAGQFVYQTAPNVTGFISTGSMYVGRAVVADSLASGSIGTAQNLAGGTAGQVPYQTAPGATSFYGPGVAGQIPVSAGAAAPVYTNTASIYVGRSNLSDDMAGGSAGQLLIQTAANVTDFISTGSAYVGRAVIADSVVGGTGFVNAVQQTANAAYYLTFVDSNNSVATAESIFTTSSFVVNPSTGNVGLGLTGPTEKLELSGAADTARIKITNVTSGRSSILAHDSSGFYWRPTNNGDVFQLRDSAGTGLVTLNPNTQFFGIGTSGPSERLHVDGAAADTRIRVSANDGTNFRGFEVRAGTSFKGGLFYRNTEGDVLQIWGPNGSVRAIDISSTPNVKVVTGTSVHNTVTGAMQVVGGLGVGGGGFFGGAVTATNFVGSFSGSVAQVNTVQGTTNAAHFVTFVDSNNATPTGETVYTTNNLTVNPSTGFVGIGTASPQARLQILDPVAGAFSADSFAIGAGTLTYPTSQGNGWASLVLKGANGDFRTQIQDGNGRVNEYWNTYLDSGGLKYLTSSEPALRIQMHVATQGFWSYYGAPSGTAGAAVTFTQGAYMETGNAIWFSPRGTSSDFYINNSGNIGIGTASPGAKLQIDNGDIWLNAPSGGNPELRFIDDGGISVAGAKIRYENNNGNLYIEHVWNQATSGIFFRNRTAGTALDTLTLMNGRAGILATSPFSKLQVGAHTFSGGNGMFSDDRVGISNHGALTGLMLASTYNDATYPEYGLVFVQGPNTSNYNVWSLSPDGPAKGSNLNFIYGANSSNIHVTAPRLVITGSSGNVGIGTSGPSFRLDVSGTARATSDFRAPIFYDSDNTAYYTDPASTSVLNGVNANIITLPQNPVGQAYANVAAQPTYYITQQRGDNDAWKIYGESPAGTNTGALILQSEDDYDSNESIRLRFKRTYGAYETADSLIAYFNYVYAIDMRAPIFYDSNDTGFYLDPASTSNLRQTNFFVQDNVTCSFTNSDLGSTYFNNRGNRYLTSNGSNWLADGRDAPLTISGSWSHTNRGLLGIALHNENNTNGTYSPSIIFGTMSNSGGYNSAYAFIMGRKTSANAGVDTNWNSGELHFYAVGTGYIGDTASMRLWNHGDMETITSIRSPIFYDYNNTGYYLDPAEGGFNLRGGSSNRVTFYTNDSGYHVSNAEGQGLVMRVGAAWSRAGIYSNSYLDLGAESTIAWRIANSEKGYMDSSSNLFAYGSMRSPIFYDNANTTYYCDPNSYSSLWGVAIRGDQDATNIGNQIFFWSSGGTTTSAIGFKASGGNFPNPTGNGDGYNTYFTMDTVGRGWVFRRSPGGSDFSAAYTSGWILNNGIWQSNGDMRAPIFYDSSDTSYNLDLASGSSLLRGRVNITGGHGSSSLRVYLAPGENGAGTGVSTLQMWCSEPGNSWDWAGFGFNVDNNLNEGGNVPAYYFGRPNTGFGQAYMRMSTDGNWYFYNTPNGSNTRYLTLQLERTGYAIAYQSMRSPIFYDQNDTGWYVDPNSVTRLNTLRVARVEDSGGTFLFRPGSGSGTTRHINLADSDSDPSAVGSATGITSGARGDNQPYYMIYVKSPYNNGLNTYTRLSLGWHTGVEIGGNPAYGGTRFMNDSPGVSTTEIMSVGRGDSAVRISSDIRSPIYYDLNDTGYYLDPHADRSSNINGFSARTVEATKGTYKYNIPRYIHTGDTNYWVGTMGWGQTDFNSVMTWGSGFFDTWSSPANSPGDTSHWVGVQAYHYVNAANSGYGWQLAGGVTDSLWWRHSWPNNSGWFKVAMYNNNASTGAFYATIYYDSNDTSYYIDGTSNSQLYRLRVGPYPGSTSNGNQTGLELINTSGTGDGNVAAMSYHCGGYYGMHQHLRHDGYFGVGGWSAPTWRWYVYMPTGDMTAAGSVTATAFYYSSDKKLKKDIQSIEWTKSLDVVRSLNPVHFTWIEDNKFDTGFIAQEVQEVLPEAVGENLKLNGDNNDESYLTLKPSSIIAHLTKVVQYQQDLIEKLEKKLEESVDRISALESSFKNN